MAIFGDPHAGHDKWLSDPDVIEGEFEEVTPEIDSLPSPANIEE